MTEVQTPFDEAPVDLEIEHPAFEPSYTAGDESGEFVMVILEEDTPTIDGRRFAPGSVSWRDLPIPLMYKTTNDGPGAGHKGSRVGGAITDVWKDGSKIYGAGHFSSGEDGQLLRELIAEGALTGVSADVGGATVELEADAESGKETRTITQGKIMMVTCLPGQAFDDSRISVTADGGPLSPPDEWFTNPGLSQPTALTITEQGKIFGHAFTWGSCHIGVRDRCLAPPHSKSGYRYFAVGQVLTFSNTARPTGVITMATDHAGITLDAHQSKYHYDHTGFQVADVAVGEDSIGGWYSGSLRSNLTPEQVRTIRASGVSGDWRSINGSLELVGLLAVNTPGFPVPRANIEGDKSLALVASGAVIPGDCSCEDMKTKFRTLDMAVLDSIVFYNKMHSPADGKFASSTGGFAPKGDNSGTISQPPIGRKELAQHLSGGKSNRGAVLSELVNRRRVNKAIEESNAVRRQGASYDVPRPKSKPREKTKIGNMTITSVSAAQRKANLAKYDKEHPDKTGLHPHGVSLGDSLKRRTNAYKDDLPA